MYTLEKQVIDSVIYATWDLYVSSFVLWFEDEQDGSTKLNPLLAEELVDGILLTSVISVN